MDITRDGPTAPFTSVFRASETRKRKRNRPTVSCTACQKRKLRCDRRRPCGACQKRGHQSVCHFTPSEGDESNDGIKEDVLSRLAALEQIVRGLADDSPKSQKQLHCNADTTTPSPQVSDTEDTKVYRNATSWAVLAESINSMQSALETGRAPVVQDIDMIFPNLAPVSIHDIINYLPSRMNCDKLVSIYFNCKSLALPFIHVHHFQRRYRTFWASPSSISILWASLLFSILSLGAMVSKTEQSSTCTADPEWCLLMAAQCLISGHYSQAKEYSAEAIIAHVHCRSILKSNVDPELLALHGIAIQVAQKRGYHRNAQYAMLKVTPFEAEMRRRVWFTIRSYDILFSFQRGTPLIIHEEDCDTDIPTNLTDDDFDEGCTELPPARSFTDPTPILYYVEQAKLFPTLCRIHRRALGIKPSTVEQFTKLSETLNQWHDSIPHCLTYRPLKSTAFTDPNYVIIHRIMLELMYLRCCAFLYCPYLISTQGLCRERAKTMDLCRDAALRIIQIDLEANLESQEQGRLYKDRDTVTSLVISDLLNAAMFICVDLTESESVSPEEREARTHILRKCYDSWLHRCSESSEAIFACRVLKTILKRIESSGESSMLAGSEPRTLQPCSDAVSWNDVPVGNFTENSNLESNCSFPEPGIDSDNVLPFDDLFTNIEPYTWNSVTQLALDEWAETSFHSIEQTRGRD